jgi:SnoaL-like domain
MSELSELRSVVADLLAREEIRELLHRYGFAADTGDALAWSRVFAADGVYDGVNGQLVGRDQFYQALDDPDGMHKRDIESRGSLHTVGGLTIQVDGLQAWAEGHALVWVRAEDGYRVYSLTYNHWDLRRTSDSWEITRRLSRPVAPGSARSIFTAWARYPGGYQGHSPTNG